MSVSTLLFISSTAASLHLFNENEDLDWPFVKSAAWGISGIYGAIFIAIDHWAHNRAVLKLNNLRNELKTLNKQLGRPEMYQVGETEYQYDASGTSYASLRQEIERLKNQVDKANRERVRLKM
jgi:hypothetical protein